MPTDVEEQILLTAHLVSILKQEHCTTNLASLIMLDMVTLITLACQVEHTLYSSQLSGLLRMSKTIPSPFTQVKRFKSMTRQAEPIQTWPLIWPMLYQLLFRTHDNYRTTTVHGTLPGKDTSMRPKSTSFTSSEDLLLSTIIWMLQLTWHHSWAQST